MINAIIDLIGRRVDDEKVMAFMEQNGFLYPKKPFPFNSSARTTYWVQNRKLGFDLVFQVQCYVKQYPVIPSDTKNVFVPRLFFAKFYNNKSKVTFPKGVDFNDNFDSLNLKIGAPTLKGSDLSNRLRNEDGTESFYLWRVEVDPERQIYLSLECGDDDVVPHIEVGLPMYNSCFILYDTMFYETFERLLTKKDFFNTADLMFLQWAIENDLMVTHAANADITQAVKEGKLPVIEWVRELDRGFLMDNDFSAEKTFIRYYTSGMNEPNVTFHRDAAAAFLDTAEKRVLFFMPDVRKELSKVHHTPENYAKVKAVIERRLEEFRAHEFQNSKLNLWENAES